MSEMNFQPHLDLKTGGWTSIPNNLIRDGKLLADSAFRLLSYLLSNREGWKVYQKKIRLDLDWGRERLSNAIKELEEKGFLHRKVKREESGRFTYDHYEYHVLPVYKELMTKKSKNSKNVTDDGLADTGLPDVGQPAPTNNNLKEEQKKVVCYPPPVVADSQKSLSKEEIKKNSVAEALRGKGLPSTLTKFHISGGEITICLDDIFRASVAKRKDWKTSEVHDAWIILSEYRGAIREAFPFIEGTIKNLRNKKKAEFMGKQEVKECKTTKLTSSLEEGKKTLLADVSEEQPSLQSLLESMEKK